MNLLIVRHDDPGRRYFSLVKKKKTFFFGMYRISGSYLVIRLSGPFFTIQYPAIRYPDNYTFSCDKQL